jgi:hypothetical protein
MLIRRGQVGNEDSRKDRAQGAALLQLGKVMEKGSASKDRRIKDKFKDAQGRTKKATVPDLVFKTNKKVSENQTLTWNAIQTLQGRRKLLGDAEFNEQAMKFLQKDAFGRGLRLRRDELENIYGLFNLNDKKALNRTGSITVKPGADKNVWWAGRNPDGTDKFSASPTKERGIAVLDMWFRQGGTDGYRGRDGRVRSPMSYDVEHVRPLSKGGKDVPSNWILGTSGINRNRQEKELGKWIDNLPKTRAEYKEYVNERVTKKNKDKMRTEILKSVSPDKYTPAEIASKSATDLSKIFAKEGASGLYLFKGGWESAKSGGDGRGGSNPPPPPIAKALGLALQANPAAGNKLASDVRNLWNNEIQSGGGATLGKIKNLLQNSLTKEQYELIAPEFKKYEASNARLFG